MKYYGGLFGLALGLGLVQAFDHTGYTHHIGFGSWLLGFGCTGLGMLIGALHDR